jgi:hypothetical protein
MLIEQRYLCYIFLLFFLSFTDFLCEASGRCVSGRPGGVPISPKGFFGCPYDTVESFWTLILLVWTSVFLRPLRGTTSGRHLSYVRKVNPVELNRFLPVPQHTFSPFLVWFCRHVHFLCVFMRNSLVHKSYLLFISTLGIFLYSFTNLF